MPDISKCEGIECPLREKCYRYTCDPDEFWQTYGSYNNALNEEKTECEYLIPLKND
jgi:hypothetical protein